MKKFLALVLLGFSLPAGAETVSAVSFNPTRLGDFEYLKVSQQINLLGGLEATGTRNNGEGDSFPGLEIASNNAKNGSVTMNTENAGTVTVKQATARYVDMPMTRFQGGNENTALHGTYDATSNLPKPETEFPVTPVLLGETGKVNVQFTQDSFAKLLQDPNGTVRVSANELSLPGELASLNVEGETSGRSTQLGFSLVDFDSGPTKETHGFLLGGVDIPYPGPHTLGDGSTTFSLKLSDASCQLQWVNRNRNTENASDRPIKVLAFNNCSTSGVSWVPQSNGHCGGMWTNMGYPADWNQHCYSYHCNCTLNAGECTSSNVGTIKTVYQIGECNDDENAQFGTPLVCNITATVYKCATH